MAGQRETETAVDRVFVSADIEGIAGWNGDDETAPTSRDGMTGAVNAAVEGVLETAPDATVTVADAHGDKRTIPPGELHEAARLVRGGPRPYGMVDGVLPETDLAFLVGYHDGPGSGGHYEHVFTGRLADVRVDGVSVGELELNATLLAHWGVPVGLVTGDDVLGETVADRLPEAEYVTAKTARGATASVSSAPSVVQGEIRTAAAAVTADPPTDPTWPVPFDPPVEVAVEYVRPADADVATLWPRVRRGTNSRTVVHEADDVETAYQFVRAATKVDAS